MSFETALLFALILLFPLIQLLMRAVRQRSGLPEEAVQQPAAARRPQKREQVPPTPQPAVAAALPARAAKPKAVPPLRSTAIDLRRAITLMTVIGPCRAANPHEWPDRTQGS